MLMSRRQFSAPHWLDDVLNKNLQAMIKFREERLKKESKETDGLPGEQEEPQPVA